MSYLYYILAALLVYLSYKSFRGGIDYLNYFKHELAKPLPAYTPPATIFAPCRGVDEGMLENLDALLSQDYPDYEIVFIVDNEADEAAGVIESAWREARRPVKLFVASKATDSSQKVLNLFEGIQYSKPESEVFVFVDSDVRPSKNWLANLIAPLADESIGAATGYRWFISPRVTFASEMRSVWNASVASALGANRKSNFCWGGSTAIRRDVFERLHIRERWKGTLSDDFTVTRALNEAGLEIHFVPRALMPSVDTCSLNELFEFTTRQMKITRVYAPKLWVWSFLGSALFTIVMVWTFMILILSARNDITVLGTLVTLTLVTFFSIGKSLLRLKAVRLVLTDHAAALRRQALPHMTLWLLTPPLFFYNCLCAWVSKRVTWRGTKYEMTSPTATRLVESGSRKK